MERSNMTVFRQEMDNFAIVFDVPKLNDLEFKVYFDYLSRFPLDIIQFTCLKVIRNKETQTFPSIEDIYFEFYLTNKTLSVILNNDYTVGI